MHLNDPKDPGAFNMSGRIMLGSPKRDYHVDKPPVPVQPVARRQKKDDIEEEEARSVCSHFAGVSGLLLRNLN